MSRISHTHCSLAHVYIHSQPGTCLQSHSRPLLSYCNMFTLDFFMPVIIQHGAANSGTSDIRELFHLVILTRNCGRCRCTASAAVRHLPLYGICTASARHQKLPSATLQGLPQLRRPSRFNPPAMTAAFTDPGSGNSELESLNSILFSEDFPSHIVLVIQYGY